MIGINETDDGLMQALTITGGPVAATMTPWITSDDLALVAQPPVDVTDGAFSYQLPARSVTSFVTN